ncbi:hypothetical protein [Streptomyces sp. ICBB 8177]|nr:hypothetical protein [Streptomyces sp. ICBB 8177]
MADHHRTDRSHPMNITHIIIALVAVAIIAGVLKVVKRGKG